MKKDPLFAGLTRPATLFGLPLNAVMIAAMVTTITFIASGSLWMMLIYPIAHIVLMTLCARDINAIALWMRWATTSGRSSARANWNAATATPVGNDIAKARRELWR